MDDCGMLGLDVTPVDFKPFNSIQPLCQSVLPLTRAQFHILIFYMRKILISNIQTICAKKIVISDDVEQIRIYYICMYVYNEASYLLSQTANNQEGGWLTQGQQQQRRR